MKKGFTLVELMVTILIIGILASVAFPQYEKAMERSRAAEPLVVWNTISKMANMAFLEKLLKNNSKNICDQWYEQAGLIPQGSNVFSAKYFEYTDETCSAGNVVMSVERKQGEKVLYTLSFALTKDPTTLELITTKTCQNGTMTDACSSLFSKFAAATEEGE